MRSWGALGALLGALGAILAALGALLGRSWALFGGTWNALVALWAASGRSWTIWTRFWSLRGLILESPEVDFRHQAERANRVAGMQTLRRVWTEFCSVFDLTLINLKYISGLSFSARGVTRYMPNTLLHRQFKNMYSLRIWYATHHFLSEEWLYLNGRALGWGAAVSPPAGGLQLNPPPLQGSV